MVVPLLLLLLVAAVAGLVIDVVLGKKEALVPAPDTAAHEVEKGKADEDGCFLLLQLHEYWY